MKFGESNGSNIPETIRHTEWHKILLHVNHWEHSCRFEHRAKTHPMAAAPSFADQCPADACYGLNFPATPHPTTSYPPSLPPSLPLILPPCRYVHRNRLSGVVIFPDDTSVLSPRFFSEARSVHWIGAASVGVLLQAGFTDLTQLAGSKKRRLLKEDGVSPSPLVPDSQGVPRYPVQGPVCTGSSVSWNHSSWSFPFPLLPIKNGVAPASRAYYPGSANYTEPELVGWHTMVGAVWPEALVRDVAVHPQQSLMDAEEASSRMEEEERRERSSLLWLGFVINARLLWSEGRGIPSWARRWSPEASEGEEEGAGERGAGGEAGVRTLEGKDPLSVFVLDERKVQTLGDCGRRLLAWWIRADARSDSKFYPQ